MPKRSATEGRCRVCELACPQVAGVIADGGECVQVQAMLAPRAPPRPWLIADLGREKGATATARSRLALVRPRAPNAKVLFGPGTEAFARSRR